MKRVLFLWDAAPFGGHDVSALAALEHLAAMPDLQVGALHTGRNNRLTEALAGTADRSARLEVIHVPAAPAVSESLDAWRDGPRTRSIRETISRWAPDCAVAVQGFITLGTCTLAACRTLRLPLISFLPMAHRVRTLRPAPISVLQDAFNRWSYSIPSAFITTSERIKTQLVELHGIPATRVAIAEYGPDAPLPPTSPRSATRTHLGFDSNAIVIGLIGRVEFSQKRQNLLIRAVARHHNELNGFQFTIIGDGPDLPAAQRLAATHGLSEKIRFLPWQQDMANLYSALDAVIIPSRFEGVPLVMLEAMARRLPVLGSDVDGMADFLPPECQFPSGNMRAMVERILALPGSPGPVILEELAELIRTRLNTRTFQTRFSAELLHLTHTGTSHQVSARTRP